MCSKPKMPAPVKVAAPAPIVQPQPQRRDVEAQASVSERRRMQNQRGVYGNIFTSVLGDPSYGTSTQSSGVAALGA